VFLVTLVCCRYRRYAVTPETALHLFRERVQVTLTDRALLFLPPSGCSEKVVRDPSLKLLSLVEKKGLESSPDATAYIAIIFRVQRQAFGGSPSAQFNRNSFTPRMLT
jgi:hypothetical protein